MDHNTKTKLEYDIAQLRHLYMHLLKINPNLADGILSPTISRLERLLKEL